MISNLTRKAFNFYTAPARFAYNQARKNIPMLKQLESELNNVSAELNQFSDALIAQIANNLGLNPELMTREDRYSEAKAALSRAEANLSTSLLDIFRALILLSFEGENVLQSNKQPNVIEGEFQKVN